MKTIKYYRIVPTLKVKKDKTGKYYNIFEKKLYKTIKLNKNSKIKSLKKYKPGIIWLKDHFGFIELLENNEVISKFSNYNEFAGLLHYQLIDIIIK
jgi:hypothetical protein